MRTQAYTHGTAPGGVQRRRSIATALRRSTLGLAALGASVSHHAMAQSLAGIDPATWRTPEYQADWGLEAMHAANAYAAGYTGLGVTVGVVDSGVYGAHPEFADGRIKPITITGTFGSDGYYFTDGSGRPADLSPQPSFFKNGDPYTVSGIYNSVYNDPHGTHVTGTIAASRDGVGMHGVAFNANVFVTNTRSTDETQYGANVDYAYSRNAYGSLAAAGARVINSSWGSPPFGDNYNSLQGLYGAYSKFKDRLGYIDALSDVAKQYDIIHVFAAGNTGYSNPNIRSSAPYFRPDIEKNWVAVGAAARAMNGSSNPADLVLASYSNRAGAAKYWYVVAPGSAIDSAAPPYTPGAPWKPAQWGINPNQQTGYTAVSGTSMAAPHATGALAVIMQRYPYMTNEQARDVLLTTAYHRNAVDGVPDANPNAPNAIWGWGVIDLNKAMKGPGQFLGPVAANLPAGTKDTWSNDIAEDALIQRKQENDAEAAAWPTRKAVTDPKLTLPALQASMPKALSTLDGVVRAFRSGSQMAILDALKANDASPIGSRVVATFVDVNGIGWAWPLSDPSLA
ncbi:S8 family peptidase [Methylobacterium sp. J-077]|uniref:S8 family peptidase n=1 Tax=Methylobacterium sp. J-077 TaxID=2836656 RepID=UPI001FB9105B|nr:S8 family peptidase [Methylobacterium sp. J-077]